MAFIILGIIILIVISILAKNNSSITANIQYAKGYKNGTVYVQTNLRSTAFTKDMNYRYADVELNATKAWLLDGAVRFENYSDFGSVATFKFATRYKIGSNFNLRGSVSTGFRAPSLQQINFSNTLTSFSGGALVQSRIARNGDAIPRLPVFPI